MVWLLIKAFDEEVPVGAFTQTELSRKDAFLKELSKSVDWGGVMNKLRKKYNMIVQDDVTYIGGDLVSHEDKIFCQLDVDVKIRLSVICDKSGNCLKLKTARSDIREGLNIAGKREELQEKTNDAKRQEMARMATNLADMIADINQSTV